MEIVEKFLQCMYIVQFLAHIGDGFSENWIALLKEHKQHYKSLKTMHYENSAEIKMD